MNSDKFHAGLLEHLSRLQVASKCVEDDPEKVRQAVKELAAFVNGYAEDVSPRLLLLLLQLEQEARICDDHAKACQEHGKKLQFAADQSLKLAAVLQVRAKRAAERIEALNNQQAP